MTAASHQTQTRTLALLQDWRDQGWLRALDLALARLLHSLDPAAPGSLLLAAALLAQLEGRGHSGLPLDLLQQEGAALLAWPDEAAAALNTALQSLPADAEAARAAWAGTPLLEIDPADGQGAAPLVLSGALLQLRRYWRHEQRVATQVLLRTSANAAALSAAEQTTASALLDDLFPRPADADPTNGPDLQKQACALALRSRFTLITGGPGTGKTYTAARLLVLLQSLHALQSGQQPLRVALAAPTGKAAARLRQSIVTALQSMSAQAETAIGPALADLATLGPARTLHALLGARPGTRRFRHDASQPLPLDLLLVDEASMVHLEMMDALLDALPSTARLVLLGDKDQLASVEAGAVLGDFCHDLPAGGRLAQHTATLRHSRRFEGAIGRLAQAVNAGDGAGAAAILQSNGGDHGHAEVAMIISPDPNVVARLALAGREGTNLDAAGGYRPYLEAIAERPADAAGFEPWAMQVLRLFDGFRVLCGVRDGPWGVAGLNSAIELALASRGMLQRRGEWYEGRPVMVTRNDPALGVFNGDIGLVLRQPGSSALRACFLDGTLLRTVSVARLADVETAFAMTVHKSQGSEFAHVVLVLPDNDSALLTRELVYTGITRARRAFTLVADDPRRLVAACDRQTRRLSGLRALLT